MRQPDYACAIMLCGGRLLLEQRGSGARRAAGRLTCFGGHRRAREDAASCLRRELREELGWCPADLRVAVDLYGPRRWIARFFLVATTPPTLRPREPGRALRLLWPWQLQQAPLSAWHRLALLAWRRKCRRCSLSIDG